MSVHENAWAGVRLLVVGGPPSIAMQLEQGISAAVPAQEVNIDSFESYSEALEFCKSRKDVGFIFVHESLGGINALDAFRALTQEFETSVGPAFGVLVREQAETIEGHGILRFSRGRLLDYLPQSELLRQGAAQEALAKLWDRYCDAFEETVVPDAIRRAMSRLSAQVLSSGSQLAAQRVARLIASRLSLTWREAVAIRWVPIVEALKVANPEFLATQEQLLRLCGDLMGGPKLQPTSLDELRQSKAPLAARVTSLLMLYAACPTPGDLEVVLQGIKELAKPGSPGLIRQFSAVAEDIRKIFYEEKFAKDGLFQRGKVA